MVDNLNKYIDIYFQIHFTKEDTCARRRKKAVSCCSYRGDRNLWNGSV